nr:transposase [Zoogloeaceae bacterium]
MTRYMGSIKRMCSEEIDRIASAHAGKFDARALRRWVLSGDADGLAEVERQRLEAVVKDSRQLSMAVTMRAELTAIWARSNASREQLLKQLQDWIARAEQSGVEQLQEFSVRLRRYAL